MINSQPIVVYSSQCRIYIYIYIYIYNIGKNKFINKDYFMFNGHKEAKRITNIKNYVRIGNDSINIRMELQFIKPHAQDQHLLNVDYCDLYYKIK